MERPDRRMGDPASDHRRPHPSRRDLLDPRRDRIRAHFDGTAVTSIDTEAETDRRGVLQGAFALLRALPFAPRDGQVSALSRMSGIPRPTVHRLLEQLQAVGAVTREDGRYGLSPNMLLLADLTEPARGLREACRDILLAVRDRTGATTQCVVSGIDGPYVLDVVAGRERLPVDIYPGREMPPGSAAAEVLARAAADGSPRGRRFSAVDREAVVPGLTCYAATFRLPSRGVGALQLSSTPRAPSETHGALVHRAAALIEERLAAAPGCRVS